KILIEALNTKHLVIGYDFTFGKNRSGNYKTLEDYGLSLTEISPIRIREHTCSSTSVRKLLSNGKVEEANRILGKNFIASGVVVHGEKIGREIGYPTMNLKVKPHLVYPKFGVYKTITYLPHLNQKFPSISSFGTRPTIKPEQQPPVCETYIPNFSADVYGK